MLCIIRTVQKGETTPLVLLEGGLSSKDSPWSLMAKLNESPNVILLYRLQVVHQTKSNLSLFEVIIFIL